MTKKTTKRALIASIISMLLCVTMLVGTTFAWFTDSVKSGRNKIVAGNLDIELEYYDVAAKGFKAVNKDVKLFDDNALWEPGHTEVAYLKVSNLGTLALKYKLNVNVYGEVAGTNVDDEGFYLSDYLVFKVVEIDEAKVGTYTRDTAMAAAGTTRGLKAYNGETKNLEKTGDADYVALIIYMPTTVNNKANYKTGTTAPSIEMGVELFATQLTSEFDSFNDQYDKFADYDGEISTAEILYAAIENGGTYKVMQDIALDTNFIVADGVEVNLDLNGHTLSQTDAEDGASSFIDNKGDLTIVGGTISYNYSGAAGGSDYANNTINNFGNLTLDDVVIENAIPDAWENGSMKYTNFAIDHRDGTLTINGGSIKSTGRSVRIAGYNNGSPVAIFNGGEFVGQVWVQGLNNATTSLTINGGTYEPAINGADGSSVYITATSGTNNVAITGGTFKTKVGTAGATKFITGGTFVADPSAYLADGYVATKNADGAYTVVEGATVANVADLEDALAAGGNIVLTEDIVLNSTLPAKNDAVIDLNGNTITAPSNGNMFHSSSDTDPSIVITSSTARAEINVSGGDTAVLLGYGSTVIKNVTINVKDCDNYSPNPFKVYGDLTLGEGTVVNIDYLGTALINNNGAHAIVIDGAKINVGTFKTNGTAIITLNQASTLEMKNTGIKIDNFVLSSFGGDSLVSKVNGVTIENCTFDVTDSNGASCTFVAKDNKYRLIQE